MERLNHYTKLFNSVEVLFAMTYQYLLIIGLYYLFFYVLRKRKYWHSKIQQKYPENKHIFREIKYSISTILIFSGVMMMVIWTSKKGWTMVYDPVSKYGYPYFFLSIILMVIMHDAYFYWMHRLMHSKWLFKWFHKIHHLSNNPTPFAAYAFHPVEAFFEFGITPIIAFTIPFHWLALTAFTLYSLLMNGLGHFGYELFPKGFASHKIFKWHNTSTHHNMHHRLVKCNYGLYFNFWDRVMGTNHLTYEESFNEVVEQREQGKVIRNEMENPVTALSLEEQGNT